MRYIFHKPVLEKIRGKEEHVFSDASSLTRNLMAILFAVSSSSIFGLISISFISISRISISYYSSCKTNELDFIALKKLDMIQK